MAELNLDAESLDTQNINELQKPQSSGNGGVVPITQEQTETTKVDGEVSEGGQMTVDELLKQQEAEATQERIKENDEKLLKEIGSQIEEEVKNDTTPESDEIQAPIETKKDEGDESDPEWKKQLHQVKQYADKAVEEAERKAWEYETKYESQVKLHNAEKQQLEETIERLSKEKIELKHNSIPSEDEAVVKFNYLRQGFKENSSDPKRSKDLSKFHLRFAANHFDVDPSVLEKAILETKSRERDNQNAMAGGYTSGGGVSQRRVTYGNTTRKTFNKDLL